MPDWIPASLSAPSVETDTIAPASALDPACKPAARFGTSATKVTQTVTTADAVAGTLETRTTTSYDVLGAGTICATVADTLQTFYDFSEQEGPLPRLVPANSATTPAETITVSETLALAVDHRADRERTPRARLARGGRPRAAAVPRLRSRRAPGSPARAPVGRAAPPRRSYPVIRSFSSARRLLALATVTALAGCSGGGGSHPALPSAPASGGGSAASAKLVTQLLPPKKFTSSATKVGPASSVGTMVMHVVVNLRDARGLVDYAAAVSDPRDGRYRQFLTAGQIGERFGASASDYAGVAQYFAANGLRVGGWPQRLALTVSGPRAAFEKAFGTTFALYRSAEGHKLVAPAARSSFRARCP